MTPLLALVLLAAQDPAFLSPIEQGVMRCTEVADGAARLACYDRTARPLRELSMGQVAPAEPAPLAAAPAPSGSAGSAYDPGAAVAERAPARGGERYADPYAGERRAAAPRAAAGRADADGFPVDVPITEITYDPRGAARLFLANGQVWDQLSSDSVTLRVSGRLAEAGLTATVRKGALGSRRMTVEPIGKTIRVRPAE